MKSKLCRNGVFSRARSSYAKVLVEVGQLILDDVPFNSLLGIDDRRQ